MESITIEQITIPYKDELLYKWKQRDIEIVPAFMLDWDGPGLSNGYGFGEWMAERYFRNKGYYVFTNEFDLITKNSKYKRYNSMINSIIGIEQIKEFYEAVRDSLDQGFKIENPDLFVFNLGTYFFVEVKKGKDKLREPQMRFFYLAERYLGVDCKLAYLCDTTIEVKHEILNFKFDY